MKLRRVFEHKSYEYERHKTTFILYSKFKFMTTTPHQAKLQSPITGHLGILASNISIRNTSSSEGLRVTLAWDKSSVVFIVGVCAYLICDL